MFAHFFAFLVIALAGMTVAAPASAQFNTCPYIPSQNGWATCNQGVQRAVVAPQPVYQGQYGQPAIVQQRPIYAPAPIGAPMGGGFTNCQMVGALAGGTLGSLAHNHTAQAVILGALAGGVVGNMVCTNSQGQRVMVQQGGHPAASVNHGGFPQNPMQGNVSCVFNGMAIQTPAPDCARIGGTVSAPQQYGRNQQPRTVSHPSDCDVGSMKDMKGLTEAQCESKRREMTVNRPGHCRIAGVDYPEFIDNEAGCRAKWNEVAQVGNRQPQALQSTDVQMASSAPAQPRDNIVRACKYQQAPGTPVLAVSVPDPSNPGWKVVPSNPGETCQEWKARLG